MMAPTPTAPGYPSYPAGYVSPQQLVAAQQLLHVSVDSFSTARFVSTATGGFDNVVSAAATGRFDTLSALLLLAGLITLSALVLLASLIGCQRCYWRV